MEKSFAIPTSDGHVIQVKLNSQETNKDLVIFAHGLTGSMREHQYFNAVPFFTQNGFDVCRFNFYSELPEGRTLSECSLSIHAKDLETVIASFCKEYRQINLVGHSLAGPVILRADVAPISKIVLWDPTKSLTPSRREALRYCKELGKYIKPGKMEILLSEEMIKEWTEASNLAQELKKITKPIKFIFAEKHDNYQAWLPFIEQDGRDFEVTVVEGATHSFDSIETERELFEETLSFIKR